MSHLGKAQEYGDSAVTNSRGQLTVRVRHTVFSKHVYVGGITVVVADGNGVEKALKTDTNGTATFEIPFGRTKISLIESDFEIPVDSVGLTREIDFGQPRHEEPFQVAPLYDRPTLARAAREIQSRIKDRQELMKEALRLEMLDRKAMARLRIPHFRSVPNEPDPKPKPSSSKKQSAESTSRSSDSVASTDGSQAGSISASQDGEIEATMHRLAMTDLFVEKAQWHLEERSKRYGKAGGSLYLLSLLVLLLGTSVALTRLIGVDGGLKVWLCAIRIKPDENCPIDATRPGAVIDTVSASSEVADTQVWIKLLRSFIVSFTAYGFLVLLSVSLARGARACLDQRERLLAKRHALRQGRLMVHLGGWETSIDDMEKAFGWNRFEINAFTTAETEAKAPWGSIVENLNKTAQELAKAAASLRGGQKPEA